MPEDSGESMPVSITERSILEKFEDGRLVETVEIIDGEIVSVDRAVKET